MVAVVVKIAACVVKQTIKGIDLDQLEIILALAPGQLPEFVEEPRSRDHRWAGVEFIAVLFKDIGAPAQLVKLFQHGHLVAARRQAYSRRQPAKPRPDHDNFFAHLFWPLMSVILKNRTHHRDTEIAQS